MALSADGAKVPEVSQGEPTFCGRGSSECGNSRDGQLSDNERLQNMLAWLEVCPQRRKNTHTNTKHIWNIHPVTANLREATTFDDIKFYYHPFVCVGWACSIWPYRFQGLRLGISWGILTQLALSLCVYPSDSIFLDNYA